jgi:hypothetical protein
LDLKDVLAALQPRLNDWVWCVRGLDWLGGERAEALCRQVEIARPGGLWLPSDELLSITQNVWQTIDGQFYAFPRTLNLRDFDTRDLHPATFPTTSAELAILAIDGSLFEVFAKDPHDLERVRLLAGVRDENVANYF